MLLIPFFISRHFIIAIFSMAIPYSYAVDALDVSVASSVWKVALSLVFIIAFIPICLWLMKRFQLAQMKLGQSDIKIVNVQSLGAKEKLMLVDVEGERILIGVTSNTITHLKSFSPAKHSFASVMEEMSQDIDELNANEGVK